MPTKPLQISSPAAVSKVVLKYPKVLKALFLLEVLDSSTGAEAIRPEVPGTVSPSESFWMAFVFGFLCGKVVALAL